MKKKVAIIGSSGAIGNAVAEILLDDDGIETIYKFFTLSEFSLESFLENLYIASTPSSSRRISATAFPIAPLEPIMATVFFIIYGFLISSII